MFWYPLRFLQGFQENIAKNLRSYQKSQSLEVKILPKPEEVQKKKKKKKQSFGGLGLGGLRNFVFLVPLQVLAIFSLKTLPEPEEAPKKPKSRGENLSKT